MVGITEEGINKAFQTQHVEEDGSTSVHYKHLVRLCKEYQLEQLSPGPRLDHLIGPAMDLLKRHLKLERIISRNAGGCTYTSSSGHGSVNVSLYHWISDVFIDMGTQAYFGGSLQEIEPELTRAFMAFEDLSWQAMYQYPKFLCGKMMSHKETVQNAMIQYFASPREHRADMSWFISKIEEGMDRLDIMTVDRAIFFFQLFWR